MTALLGAFKEAVQMTGNGKEKVAGADKSK
jgi:hypothetical protein